MLTPTELFGDNIVSDLPLKHCIYLTNHNKDVLEHKPISVTVYAYHNVNLLFSELYLGMKIFNYV